MRAGHLDAGEFVDQMGAVAETAECLRMGLASGGHEEFAVTSGWAQRVVMLAWTGTGPELGSSVAAWLLKEPALEVPLPAIRTGYQNHQVPPASEKVQ